MDEYSRSGFGSKGFALIILIIGIIALVLQVQKKLMPTMAILYDTRVLNFLYALIVFIVVIMLLPEEYALWLTSIIVMGALIRNAQKMGKNDLIHTMFQQS